jgi:lipopolysaccharide/colanic/teichoic acid biosynthesis glycosyltransferase
VVAGGNYAHDLEIDMHGAVSAALDVTSSRTSRKRRVQPERTTGGVGLIDVAVDIRAVPDADLSTSPRVDEEILPRERSEALCRIVNVAVAMVALVCLLPVMILIALAIKLTSRGPIFYAQTRVGVDRRSRRNVGHDRRGYDAGGKPFVMYKFRTMRVNAEADGRAVWASRQDPRVTVVGGFLRRTRLDELPQLLNVVRGEMNVVGPRPERPAIFADLRRNIPEYPLRQRVKPGITGWAQINQAYDACVDDVRRKVRYDLEYVQRQGMLEDLRIMAMTLPVMMFRRGGW